MSDERVRDDIEAFLTRYIDSVVQLELLILLRQRPDDAWTPEAVARELRVEPGWTASELDRLAACGLVSLDAGPVSGYRYAQRTPELERSLAGLIELYEQRRVTVINLIYTRPGDAIRSFADAFRLRKD